MSEFYEIKQSSVLVACACMPGVFSVEPRVFTNFRRMLSSDIPEYSDIRNWTSDDTKNRNFCTRRAGLQRYRMIGEPPTRALPSASAGELQRDLHFLG
jgi:hypothetical protein